MTPPDSHQPRTPDGRYTHKTSAPDPGRLGDLAAQTEPPRPPDSDDPAADDWWYEHGETWVKNTATPDDLERVVDDYWGDGYGVPEAIAQAVYRDDCPTGVIAAVLDGAHLPSFDAAALPDHISFAVGEDIGRAARHPNRPGDWARSAALEICDGGSFNDGFFNQFDSPDRQRGLRNPADTAALLAALRHEGELGDEAVVDVASHPNTPPETLARLAGDAHVDEAVRQSVAANPTTPPDALTALADDEDDEVRWRVALNPNTPPETLTRLAADEDDDVREAAATNPNTPPAGRAAAGLLTD